MINTQRAPKLMTEAELLNQIRQNELGILDAQRTANDLSRANLYLRNELNARRRKQREAFAGFSVGQMIVISSHTG